MGDYSGDAGLLFQCSHNGYQGLLAFFGVRGWEPLDHEDDAVNEWRMKTSVQVLPDDFRFATFDTGGCLQMALGVKREWEKRNGGGKD